MSDTGMLFEFENMLTVDLCLSGNTTKAYISDVRQFLSWKKSSPFHKRDLYLYIEEHLKGLKTTSINRKLASISAWINFMNREYKRGICIDLPLLRKEKSIPKTITNASFEEMRRVVSSYKLEFRLKISSILETIYSTGMRVSELVRLKMTDLRPVLLGHSNGVVINGKGEKERLVFIAPGAKKILQEYCDHYKIKSGYVWPGEGNRPITRQAIYYMISDLGKKIHTKVSPHSLRHRLAVNLVQNGMELVAVQKILGHSHINTTAIYTSIDDDLIYEMVEKYHPLGTG